MTSEKLNAKRQQLATESLNQCQEFLNRVEYYADLEDEDGICHSDEWLRSYVLALQAYAQYVYFQSQVLKTIRIIKKERTNPKPAWSIFSTTLIEISNMLKWIAFGYEYFPDEHFPGKEKASVEKAIFIERKIVLIMNQIEKYKTCFHEDDLRFYNKNLKRLAQNILEKNRDIQYSFSIKEETDQDFKIIRESLLKISTSLMCPITLEGGDCFMISALYENSIHPDLETFRDFRDQKLLTTPIGKKIVKIYYRLDPNLATFVTRHPRLRSRMRHYSSHFASWLRNKQLHTP